MAGGSTQLGCDAGDMCGADEWYSAPITGRSHESIRDRRACADRRGSASSPAERQQVLWKTNNRVFRLGLVDTAAGAQKARRDGRGVFRLK